MKNAENDVMSEPWLAKKIAKSICSKRVSIAILWAVIIIFMNFWTLALGGEARIMFLTMSTICLFVGLIFLTIHGLIGGGSWCKK